MGRPATHPLVTSWPARQAVPPGKSTGDGRIQARPPPAGSTERSLVRFDASGTPSKRRAVIAEEEPLEIRVDGDTVAVTMRTPGDDRDLALGFLYGEGLIASARDVGTVAHCGRTGHEGHGNVIDVRSAPGLQIEAERILESRRWSTTTSACGVCGRRTIEALLTRCGRVDRAVEIVPAQVTDALARLAAAQRIFAHTGGVHAAAALDVSGDVVVVCEDVGRHNAVDKVIGFLVRQRGLAFDRDAAGLPALLAVSSRASFEIVQKAAAAHIPIVACVSAPSSLAIETADAAGVTLLGFVRDGAFNAYAHAWRIAASAGG